MKYIIPTFEKIEWMPPTITLIQKLANQGNEVVYITLFPDTYFSGYRGDGSIRNLSLCGKNISLNEKHRYVKGISGILFRIDNMIKRVIATRLSKAIESEETDSSILWVVNEMTVLFAGTHFLNRRRYIFTIYELHKKSILTRRIVKAAREASIVVVPEYCRAHIMQSWYNLSKCPVVLPNKPDIDINLLADAETIAAIEKIESIRNSGKIAVLYMGGITPERPLDKLIDAIGESEKYRLIVMGKKSTYLDQLKKKYPGAFEYIGNFTPPQHLLVAAHAGIGVLIYVSINQAQGLNALFCAPNKIYEYAGLGLPMIVNDIPGLHFEILTGKMGHIVDYNDMNSILSALDNICDNYSEFSKNAIIYYNRINIDAIINKVIDLYLAAI